MSRPRVAFLDSGVGGIPYLVATREAFPSADYAYYADTANFPYGDKSIDALRSIVIAATGRIVELFDPDVVVVACNTASVVALEDLRHRFARPFVGVVPAIKPAASLVPGRPIGVLATERTVTDVYVADLLARFAPDNPAVLVAAGGLVDLVENRLSTASDAEVDRALEESLGQLRNADVAAVVLGCTHFIHLRSRIEAMLGPGVAVVDSVAGVVRQTLRLAGDRNRGGEEDSPGTAVLHTSDPARSRETYAFLARAHRLVLSGYTEARAVR